MLMAVSHFVVTLVDRTMTWVYEKSDGRLGSRLGKMRMLVLHTTGRKSGEKRSHTRSRGAHERPNHTSPEINCGGVCRFLVIHRPSPNR